MSDIPVTPGSRPGLAAALADRYTIERELGRGGNAVVYLARDLKHKRHVAVKVLLPELALSVRAERFLREIEIAAHLTHPHILPLYDSGEGGGCLYYVMPYVEGKSLRARLERDTRLPLSDALQIAREVAEALSYAHRHNVLHRDIKPENILLHEGHALVADFGIARALEAAEGQTLTQTGIAVGTPLYMSPEQSGGSRSLDGRSDLYSLGCVLYEMLAGVPPFAGDTPQEIFAHHALDPAPELRKLRPDVPAWVGDAIRKAMAKPPTERFVNVGEFAGALTSGHHAAPRHRLGRRAATILGTATLIGLLAFATVHWWPTASGASVAVLPFVNLSGDSATDFFSDGMTEEVINALTQIASLRIPARTSAFVFKGRTGDIRDIGRRLNVANVVEGSVRRSGDRLRVTAQLINVNDGFHLWSENYDRELHGVRDIIDIQDGIARAIAGALQVKLAAGAVLARPHTDDPQAYDLYLRGRYFWSRRTPDGVVKAIESFRQAIERDSNYALAYSGLADAYILAPVYAGLSQDQAFPHARAAALKAISLDSTLAEAYVSLARVREDYDWDWNGAEAAFRRALQLNPRYGLAHNWYGFFLAVVMSVEGRAEEGTRETRQALDLDPLNPAFNMAHGSALTYARDYADAIEYERRAIELDPNWWTPHLVLGWAYLGLRQYDHALTEFQVVQRMTAGLRSSYTVDLAYLGYTYAMTGRQPEALALLKEIQTRPRDPGFWQALATVYVGLGDRDRTLAALDSSVEQRSWQTAGPKFGAPIWDPVRSDPRFAGLVRKAGLGP